MSHRLSILHAPFDVGGHAFGLSRAERELGYRSDVAVMAPGPFGYGFDVDLKAGLAEPVWTRLARRALFLRSSVRRYDIFHFNFGQTLFTVRQLGRVFDELAWLKRRGKTIFVTYQGCDVRPKAACPCRRPHCFAEDRYRQPAAQRVLRLADRVFYLNPDLRRWLPGATFTPYASVDARQIEQTPELSADEVVVVHAPTDVDIKGTRFVVDAVEQLRSDGLPIRLELVEGVMRDEVEGRIRAGHIVVDQLLLGWYGAVSVEAMALGRPVLCYVREDEPEDNPFGSELPIVRTTAESLAENLRRVALDADVRRRLGEEGRRFAAARHDPRHIARTVLEGIAEASVVARGP
ncbi:MAG: glycosyltransferase [Actinomycetota bacterium]|nr:glycosyltransferase [Actinomycetota bacterium]